MRQLQWYALQYSKVTISCTQQYQVISAQYWNYTIVEHWPIENSHCNCNYSKPASHGSQERDSIVAFDKVATSHTDHTIPTRTRWKNFTQTHSLLRLPDCQNEKDLTCENWWTDLMILLWWGAMRGLLSLSMASIIALQARSRRAYSRPKHPAAAAYYHSLRSCI